MEQQQQTQQSTPFHTTFFDVITIPSNPSPAQSNPQEMKQIKSFNSIMAYEDAILDAIADLHDSHNGSSIQAIQKHIQAYFLYDNYPELDEQEAEYLSQDMQWNEHLFHQALKSLLEKKQIIHCPTVKNGSTFYKLSPEYKKHRAEELQARLKRLEDYKKKLYEKRQQMKKKKDVPLSKPFLKKAHLVEEQGVELHISDQHGTNKMELVREHQIDKRKVLHHKLDLHADDDDSNEDGKKKPIVGLRDKLKIPHHKIFVKEM